MLGQLMQRYGPHYRALTRLGLPIVVGQIGMIVLGFADTLMIGHYGTGELAAASFVNSMFNLCIIFCTGFSYGLTPVAGGLYGNGEYGRAGQALRCSLLANLLVAFLLMVVMAGFFACIGHMGQPRELLPLIRPYFMVLWLSLPFVMLFNAFKQFTDGITDTQTAMWLLLGGNGLNIVGNYALIYGKLGMPELGLLGAGVSTLFSRAVMVAVYVVLVFTSRKYEVYRNGFVRLGFSGRVFRRLNALGWPVGLQMGMETASFSLTAIMVGWLGVVALASHQIMLTISQFAFMMYYGLGAAVAVRESNFMGRGDIVEARRVAYAGFHLMLLLEVVLMAILFPLHATIGGWFTDNGEVVGMVSSLFIPFAVYQFGDGLQITFSNALRGISDVKPVVLFAFIAFFMVSLPVGYLFAFVFHWGLPGIWMSFPFGLTSAGTMFWLRYHYRMKQYGHRKTGSQ